MAHGEDDASRQHLVGRRRRAPSGTEFRHGWYSRSFSKALSGIGAGARGQGAGRRWENYFVVMSMVESGWDRWRLQLKLRGGWCWGGREWRLARMVRTVDCPLCEPPACRDNDATTLRLTRPPGPLLRDCLPSKAHNLALARSATDAVARTTIGVAPARPVARPRVHTAQLMLSAQQAPPPPLRNSNSYASAHFHRRSRSLFGPCSFASCR